MSRVVTGGELSPRNDGIRFGQRSASRREPVQLGRHASHGHEAMAMGATREAA